MGEWYDSVTVWMQNQITTKIYEFRTDFIAGSCQRAAACFIIISVCKNCFRDMRKNYFSGNRVVCGNSQNNRD